MEKLNRAQKCSFLGPQNLGSRGVRAPPPGSAPLRSSVFLIDISSQDLIRLFNCIGRHNCLNGTDSHHMNVCPKLSATLSSM